MILLSLSLISHSSYPQTLRSMYIQFKFTNTIIEQYPPLSCGLVGKYYQIYLKVVCLSWDPWSLPKTFWTPVHMPVHVHVHVDYTFNLFEHAWASFGLHHDTTDAKIRNGGSHQRYCKCVHPPFVVCRMVRWSHDWATVIAYHKTTCTDGSKQMV